MIEGLAVGQVYVIGAFEGAPPLFAVVGSIDKQSPHEQAQSQLSGALSRLLVTIERYPDLKANQNFLELQAQLEGTENRIAVERKKFNEVTRDYNAYIKKFPQVIYSGWFDFEKKGYFEADAGAEKAPEVDFSN